MNIVGATTSLTAATSGIGNVIDTGNALGAAFGAISSPLGGALPAPNILSNYADYTYIVGISALTKSDHNFPDQSYKAGKVLPLICKTAGADPDNRVATGYGKFDFFMDNITFETLIGHQNAKTTNVTTVQFDVFEPYSIGLFMLALQKAADNAGHSNWRDAPFLLSIEFRGNNQQGIPVKVPFSTRHIPIKFSTVTMKANEQGCKYLINAYATQGQALTTEFANLKTDTVIKGKTIQEVLQTGEQSLQSVVNAKLQEFVKKGDVKVADQIVILFPKEDDMPSFKAAQGAGTKSGKNAATLNPQLSSAAPQVYKQLGVNPTTLQQSEGAVNVIGGAKMGFGPERRGDAAPGNEQNTWDPVGETWLRGKLVPNAAEGTFKFAQDTDIPTAINQIILSSAYAETALAENAVDENGMRTWWRIDTQVYYVDSPDNVKQTGKAPKIAVYKIVPFKVHPGKVGGYSKNIEGIDKIKRQCVKRYDYIFTGKNTEVINFNIDYSIGFANAIAADSYRRSQDDVEAAKGSSADNKNNKDANIQSTPPGEDGAKQAGSQSAGTQKQTVTGTSSDGTGGGGQDTKKQRVGRTFHDAITNPVDMINIELEIIGDPYWIANSGMGNYIAKPVKGVKDLHQDGSVNWQTSQVDTIINFRTPVDLNNLTGLYDFKGPNHQDMSKNPKGGPAIGFTGAYCINMVTNYFKGGSFRQMLKGYRRGNQEKQKTSPAKDSANAQTPAKDK